MAIKRRKKQGIDNTDVFPEETRGRKNLLTPEREQRLIAACKLGYTRSGVAAAGGICLGTLEEWLTKGREGMKGCYVSFYKKMMAAQAIGLNRDLALIDRVGEGENTEEIAITYDVNGIPVKETRTKKRIQGNWKAKAWKIQMLMRFFPEEVVFRPGGGLPADSSNEPIQINYVEDRE